jgi:predicted  nucleic acid-binding Zn-ribbon protein
MSRKENNSMNENEIRREIRVTKKLLSFIDQKLEEVISNERLTGADSQRIDAAVSQSDETFLALSKERRALLRLLNNQLTSDSDKE